MLAFIDIHKHVFQACVLDPQTGEVNDARFAACADELARWASRWQGVWGRALPSPN
jgi:hypothetical protein